MLRRLCRRPGPRDDVARALRGEKVTPADMLEIPVISAGAKTVYNWGLDKCVTMPLGLRPDAAGRLPLLARTGADSWPGFASFCASVAAVWLAGGSIPSLQKGPGSLSPAFGGRGSCSQAESLPPRRERVSGGTKDRRLLAG